MVKVKRQRKSNFTVIDNTVLQDTELTFKAKGLFAYLWSQSDDWNFYETEVVKHSKDGISSLRSGIHELEERGYLQRKRIRVLGLYIYPFQELIFELHNNLQIYQLLNQEGNQPLQR